MSPPTVIIKAPNGREITLNTGLFINNQWVEASNGQTLQSINPAYVPLLNLRLDLFHRAEL